MLYVAITSENSVISIEETRRGPYVRLFATGDSSDNNADESGAATPYNLDFVRTRGFLNSPDNLTIDALGNIYVIEDAPNSSSTGGDIWFGRDTNNDGVAESLDHFMSIQVQGAESTGMIFNPSDPTKFVVAVQHPTSTALGDDGIDGVDDMGNPVLVGEANDGIRDVDSLGMGGVVQDMGDAIWEFDISNVTPPSCDMMRGEFVTFDNATGRWVKACTDSNDFIFVPVLERAERADGAFPVP